jgi:hypothetical protein
VLRAADHERASDRDREHAVALLRERCVEGYLSIETLEHRIGRAMGARTMHDLHLLLADIARVKGRWRAAFRQATAQTRVALPETGSLVVGRSDSCDVTVNDSTVSRRHLELRALDGAWLAVDLGSMNGTWLLGQRMARARVLPGDELVLGDCFVALEAPASGG